MSRRPVPSCTGPLLPKHLNNYVTVLKTAPQFQKKNSDCDLMTGKPLKKPSRKGNRVCSRLNLALKNLHGSSFNSRLTFSWIQKQHCHGWETSGEKEATDWMSNTKATMVAQSPSGWLCRCPHWKQALGRLCRINKQSRVGNCCIVRDCEFLHIAWLVLLQSSRCLERANREQTTPQGRRSDLKTIKWKVGQ